MEPEEIEDEQRYEHKATDRGKRGPISVTMFRVSSCRIERITAISSFEGREGDARTLDRSIDQLQGLLRFGLCWHLSCSASCSMRRQRTASSCLANFTGLSPLAPVRRPQFLGRGTPTAQLCGSVDLTSCAA